MTNRIWVDQDECRLFVLNLETVFPRVYGNPRGLFTVLSSASTGQNQSGSGSTSSNPVLAVLGLCGPPGSATMIAQSSDLKDEIAEAVSSVLNKQNNSVAKVSFLKFKK